MQRSYDVVVIGGGVMGLAIAAHLRRLGAGDVVLLERRFLGAGASGKSSALLRQHGADAQSMRMARAGLGEFAAFQERTGRDIGFRRPGALLLVPESERAELEAGVALQRREGIQVSVLDQSALHEFEPRARFEGVVAAWEPEAGRVDPVRVLGALGAEATRQGVDVQLGCEANGFMTDAGGDGQRVLGVETTFGRIATRQVVVAAGPWSARLLSPLGISLPIEAVRAEHAFLRPPADFGDAHPIVVDRVHGVCFAPEDGGATRVGDVTFDDSERIDPEACDEGISSAFLARARERVQRLLPAYERAVLWSGGSGLCAVTPDAQPLIGGAGALEGLVVAAGFGDRGFAHAPVVGRGTAELVVHGTTLAFDLDAFDPERFRRHADIEPGQRHEIPG